MSKLFDTLEKIQDQEDTSPRAEQAATPSAPRKTGRYFPFLVGLTAIVAIIAVGKYLPIFTKGPAQQPDRVQTSRPATTPANRPPISHAASQAARGENLPTQARIEYFNNHAVDLTKKGDAWAALYYFDKAGKLAPEQPEPLINMAIILSQMDLGFPASRIFTKAYQLAPDNDHLLQAIELAIAEQVLPPDFYETIPVPGTDGT